ncbi:Snf7-domain-containing protein [Dipodascopsis tothii]|uniref:Snf7-domain-containing protein n=1 Tax=Dipodascopsis tothii TaxID=44089 RepID=UPI0034CEE6AF
MWSYFFGGNASTKKDAPKNAIIGLRTQLDMLAKKEKHIEQQILDQTNIARKNVNTNKLVAKNALKRKKMLESNLEKVQAQIATLEAQSNAIESANLNFETMKVMQSGAKAMKQIHGNMNMDKVDATMDEIREQVALSEEIGEAISRPLGHDLDEDELEDELEALEQEALDAKMVNAGTVPARKLPDVGSPSRVDIDEDEEDEEEELRKLQREMAA